MLKIDLFTFYFVHIPTGSHKQRGRDHRILLINFLVLNTLPAFANQSYDPNILMPNFNAKTLSPESWLLK